MIHAIKSFLEVQEAGQQLPAGAGTSITFIGLLDKA